MRKIIYYVASSIDGYIAGVNGEIGLFAQQKQGEGVQQYLADLQEFDTVIMGRKTYEFGYQYGLTPGQLAYPHMQHYIFSSSLQFKNKYPSLHVCELDLGFIQELKSQEGSDIYLCGGGQFAAWLLEKEMIDVVKIKLNPIVLGSGVRLFGHSEKAFTLELKESKRYDDNLQISSYTINY